MLIEFIKLENWRSFYGENEFWVSTDSEKNVTLIRAENGVGKTSLLAAINWCFFNILPSESEFENRTKLVNDFAVKNDGATLARVQIDFQHENVVYRASRTYDQTREKANELKLTEFLDTGEVPSQKRPDRFINSVIPKEMAPHFFFYGEATSRYTGATGAKQFGKAVKGILGSTIARMALSDLEKVLRDYKRQAADNTSVEAQAIQSGIQQIDNQVLSLTETIEKVEGEIELASDTLDRLNQELAGTEQTKNAQKRRVKKEQQLAAKHERKKKLDADAKGWIGKFSTSILAEELLAEAQKVIDKEDTRGKLPAPYDQKFVNELLEDAECVCGRPVLKGSPEYERIKSLLETAGDQAVMSRVMSTSSFLGTLSERSKGAWGERQRNNEDLIRLNTEISRLDADLLEISKELEANPHTDIAEKERARDRAQRNKRNAENEKIQLLANITSLEGKKQSLERQLRDLTAKSEAAKRYIKRAQVSADLTERLQSRLFKEENIAREVIEKEIDSIVERFMRKSAKVKLDSDYQLRLLGENGKDVAKSTGENQLLGLAFTGAIAKYAKERRKEVSDLLLPGTVAPLVVDSPFGHLDPQYRKGVSDFLPELASQVILLVSTSQASDSVMEALSPKVGAEYVLTRHNQADRGARPEEHIPIRGKTYDLTAYSSEIEGTKIVEVPLK